MEERSDEDLEKHSTYILAPLTNVFSFFSTYLLISGQEMAMGQTKSLSKNDTSRMIRWHDKDILLDINTIYSI